MTLRQSATMFGILPVNALAEIIRRWRAAQASFSVSYQESFISVLISWRILRK